MSCAQGWVQVQVLLASTSICGTCTRIILEKIFADVLVLVLVLEKIFAGVLVLVLEKNNWVLASYLIRFYSALTYAYILIISQYFHGNLYVMSAEKHSYHVSYIYFVLGGILHLLYDLEQKLLPKTPVQVLALYLLNMFAGVLDLYLKKNWSMYLDLYLKKIMTQYLYLYLYLKKFWWTYLYLYLKNCTWTQPCLCLHTLPAGPRYSKCCHLL